jgi:Fe-S-cluster containining protein
VVRQTNGENNHRLSGLELDGRRLGRVQTAELLKRERTPLRVIAVAELAVTIAENGIKDAKKLAPPPALACTEGCDWCCYLRVGTAAPEVLRIAAYLHQTQSPEELQATRQRIDHTLDQRSQTQAARRTNARIPCPLLVNHRCIVYPVRPLTCRGANSRDARACEQFLDRPKATVLPNYSPQHRLTTFVLDGLRAGATEAGLKGDLLELTAALRIALETPNAAERWLAGEAIFTAARLP